MPVLGSGSGVVGGIYQATASGAIAHGKACIINSNGTVSQASAVLGKKIVFIYGYTHPYQYKLANDAYDVTEAITKDGETDNTYYYAAQDGAGYGDQFYSLVSSQEGGIGGIQFSSDGTKFFVTGYNGDDVNEYTLSTAYDLSTGTFVDAYDISGKTTYPSGIDFKSDGTEMYIVTYGDSNIHQYTLSTGWDVSTSSFTRTLDTTRDDYCHGIRFKPDGTKMYICGSGYTSADQTDQYTLSTAWDISSASFDSISLDHSSHDTSPQEILWNDDGTKFFMLGGTGHTITEYTCSTAYQLSSASFLSETFIMTGTHSAMAFSQGGTATNENYIGISQGAVSDGGTASIKVIGGIDTNQSGLTPNALCYIADSGTITSTDTGVIAGQALTPTTVLIKNQYDMLFD